MTKKNKNIQTSLSLGFSLVELLVVISIIGIVSVVAAISFSKAQINGRDQRRIGDLKAIQNGMEQYYLLSGGSYPTSKSLSLVFGSQTILQTFPKDPKGGDYTYTFKNGTYCVCSDIEDIKNGNAENLTDCNFSNVSKYYCVGSQQL